MPRVICEFPRSGGVPGTLMFSLVRPAGSATTRRLASMRQKLHPTPFHIFFVLLLALAPVNAQTPTQPQGPVAAAPSSPVSLRAKDDPRAQTYRIGIGDVLIIRVFAHQDL